MKHISFLSLFRKGNMGGKLTGWEKSDWSNLSPGEKTDRSVFPQGKNGPAHSSLGKKMTGKKMTVTLATSLFQ